MVTLDLNPDSRTLRGFARLWFPLFVLAIGAVLRWRFGMPTLAIAAWTVGAAAWVAALVSRRVARAVFVALTIVTYPVALLTSTIVLAFMFFVVLTPLGLVLRMRGHDPLRLRGRSATSYWQPYRQDDDPRRATRQF